MDCLNRFFLLTASLFTSLYALNSLASDLDQAPPAFPFEGGKAVPVDFIESRLEMSFDANTQRATGKARIEFQTAEEGYPVFDIVPVLKGARLNGKNLRSVDVVEIPDPDKVTRVRVLRSKVKPGKNHILELKYALPVDEITFLAGKVRMGFFMTDLQAGGRGYLERYAPSSFEHDHFKLRLKIQIENTSRPHKIFANGKVNQLSNTSFEIEYPNYYTTSSFYMHLTEEGRFKVKKKVFEGLQRNIPITVYAGSASNVDKGMTKAFEVMREIEATYGPYTHGGVLIYVTPSGGGMEYAGATMTSLWALPHEITHFWFARGVMPADGNSGWIDEAIARWRDYEYWTAPSGPNRKPVNLAGFPSWRRETPMASYSKGSQLLAELDFLFKQAGHGGVRPALRKLYQEKKRLSITTPFFQEHLERFSGLDLQKIFDRYVRGQNILRGSRGKRYDPRKILKRPRRNPHIGFTQEQIRKFR